MPLIRKTVTLKGHYAHCEIKSSDIPSVRDLQKALGFGNKGDSENTKFKKAVKEYIDSSKTKSGIPGSSLTKWRDRSERDELYDMARGFLENKGLDFWPDGPTDSDTQLHRYSRDHDRLVSLLAQLFFRVNTQSKQTVARQQAAIRKRDFSDSLNESSSSAMQTSPTTSRTTVARSPDPISSSIYHRTPSEEIDLYRGPESEDEYIPAMKLRGKRSAAAPAEEQSQLAKLPRHSENDLRDPFEDFTVSPFQVQTQSPNVAGQRASFDTIGALGSSQEPHIAEDTTSGPFSTSPNHYDTTDAAINEPSVVRETIERDDDDGHVATGADVAGNISNRVEVKEDTRSPTADILRYPQYPEERDHQNVATSLFNIDYTIHNDKGEPTPGWRPPRHFFDTSFDELLEALPFVRPQGISICLEDDFLKRKFQRTARTQARFSELQELFMRFMKDVKGQALKEEFVPNFEIVIYSLEGFGS